MIQADADTYTDQSFPDTNYGTGVELWAGNANGTKQTYLRFPQLASLAGYYIYSAELRLYPIDVIGTNWDYEGFVGMLESGWNEPTLDLDNNTTSVKAGTGWIMQVKEYPYNNWDVTGVVRKWYAGELLPHGFTVAARSVNIGEAVMAKYHTGGRTSARTGDHLRQSAADHHPHTHPDPHPIADADPHRDNDPGGLPGFWPFGVTQGIAGPDADTGSACTNPRRPQGVGQADVRACGRSAHFETARPMMRRRKVWR